MHSLENRIKAAFPKRKAKKDVCAFVLSVSRSHGLLWATKPRVGTTERAIRQQAKKAEAVQVIERELASLPVKASPELQMQRKFLKRRKFLERERILAQRYQTTRGEGGDEIFIPVGEHQGRRPDVEVTHAVQLIDECLKRAFSITDWERHEQIAEILNELGTVKNQTGDTIRKRLARAGPLPLSEYKLALYKFLREVDPKHPPVFPFEIRRPVTIRQFQSNLLRKEGKRGKKSPRAREGEASRRGISRRASDDH